MSYIEDEEGLPATTFTKDMLECLYENKGYSSEDITVIKTKHCSFVYHKCEDPEYVKEFLKQCSVRKPCAVFGSHRVADTYTFGIAENGEIKRYLYSDEYGDISDGEETEFEKLHPFKTLETFNDKPEDIDFIDEEYVFEMEKWFAGFDIENEDVEILEIKVYTPCEWNGNIYNNEETKIVQNLKRANTDYTAIFVAHNTENKTISITAEHLTENNERHPIYCDYVSFIHNTDEITLSLRRCIQAISTLDLNISHPTMASINNYFYSEIKNPKTNIAIITIDTEKRFMIGVSRYQRKGKRKKLTKKYINGYNMFYDLSPASIESLVKQTIKLIK